MLRECIVDSPFKKKSVLNYLVLYRPQIRHTKVTQAVRKQSRECLVSGKIQSMEIGKAMDDVQFDLHTV